MHFQLANFPEKLIALLLMIWLPWSSRRPSKGLVCMLQELLLPC